MRKKCVWGLLVGNLITGRILAAESAGLDPGITLRYTNSAKISPGTLGQATRLAASILSKAGVNVTWQDCSVGSADRKSAVCASDLGDAEFLVHFSRQKSTAAPVLGFTVFNGDPGAEVRSAAVYYPMVRILAMTELLAEWEILGAVLAHETGHLLGVGHAEKGVMSAQFAREHILQTRLGGLKFSELQGGQMRAEIARRQATSLAGSEKRSPTPLVAQRGR